MARTNTQQKKHAAPALEAKVYTHDGSAHGTVTLPEAVFGVRWNPDLVHEVVRSMQSNARTGTADTKDRSEVRGGGKKPWRQKGTGRARHGSRRSPIWVGGGVAHGPIAEKDYSKKINKNARARALASVLSQKYADGEIVFVDALGMAAPSAKEARQTLSALGSIEGYDAVATKKQNAVLVVLPGRNEAVEKSFRNFGNVYVTQAKDINPVDVLTFKHTLFVDPAASLPILSDRVATKKTRTAKTTNA